MSKDEDQAVAQAIRRAAQDLVNLSQAGEQAMEQPGTDHEKAQSQEDLQQGASQVVDDLIETGKDTPYLGSEATKELGRAINAARELEGRVLAGQRRARAAVGPARRARRSTRRCSRCARPSRRARSPARTRAARRGSSREKMQGLANQQGDLNQESQSLAERLTQQQRLAAGDQATIERLAAQQQMIRAGPRGRAQEREAR